MKKIFIYLLIFICVIFILPAIFTKNKLNISKDLNENAQENTDVDYATKTAELAKYDYQSHSTIKLFHHASQEIQELPIDEYLYGVVSSEMPANYDIEALKAQAVVARTYTLYQITNSMGKHGEADICDDSNCCQAWISKEDRLAKWDESERNTNWDKIVYAVSSTAGQIITYNGIAIDAFFHANSGGTTEIASNVWGGKNFPYLQSVQTSGEEGYTQYSSEVVLNKNDLISKLQEKHSEVQINFDEQDCIKILEYTESGRVRTIKFGNIQIAGTEARSIFGLKSTNFEINIEGDNIKFSVKGYGHGVGMSQTGADSMAKQGSNYEEIIKHFYTDVEIAYI